MTSSSLSYRTGGSTKFEKDEPNRTREPTDEIRDGDFGSSPSSLLRPDAAGAYLGGISSSTLAKWRCIGLGPMFVRLSGSRVFYRRADLDDFIESNRFANTSEADAMQYAAARDE